jgi:hypothetical protein
MPSVALHLIPYALVAALSPLGFAATVAVMGSGRLKALGFAIGFVSGQLLACSILVLVGVAVIPNHEKGHQTLQEVLLLGSGLALLWFAAAVRRRPQSTAARSNARSQAMLERLRRLHVGTAIAAGVLLGIGGPKRLVLTVLASTLITTSGIDASKKAALIGWYAMLATVLVWVPILAFELFGDRAVTKLDAAQRWLASHQRQAMFYALLLLGAALLADAVASLI